MKIGYARTNNSEKKLLKQIEALKAAGCEQIFSEIGDGDDFNRPILQSLINTMNEGDILIVRSVTRLTTHTMTFEYLLTEFKKKNIKVNSFLEPSNDYIILRDLIFRLCIILKRWKEKGDKFDF